MPTEIRMSYDEYKRIERETKSLQDELVKSQEEIKKYRKVIHEQSLKMSDIIKELSKEKTVLDTESHYGNYVEGICIFYNIPKVMNAGDLQEEYDKRLQECKDDFDKRLSKKVEEVRKDRQKEMEYLRQANQKRLLEMEANRKVSWWKRILD